MLFRTIPVSPLQTNCYLLGDDSLCCLVDPGGDGELLAETVRATGLTLSAILLTHGHWDHWGGVAALLEAFPGVPVYIHKKEISEPDRSPSRYSFPAVGSLRFVSEGDTVQIGSLSLQVLHTPGHSAGSLIYLCGDMMLAGDTLFAGSCGRCDLPGGSIEEMMSSLGRLAALQEDFTVYPGHGPATTLVEERCYNPYMRQATQSRG